MLIENCYKIIAIMVSEWNALKWTLTEMGIGYKVIKFSAVHIKPSMF